MLVKHSAYYFAGRVIPGALSLATLALYTRLLTADQYGQYALAVAAVGFVTAVCFQWLNISLGRFLPGAVQEPEALLSTALVAFLMLVAVTGLAASGFAWNCPNTSFRWLIAVTVVLGWTQAWFELNQKILNIHLAPIRYGLISSARSILALGLGVLFFYCGLGLLGILSGSMVGSLIPTFAVRGEWRGTSLRYFRPKLLVELVSYGIPLAFTFMSSLILNVSDRFLLVWLMDTKAAGAYSAAYDLAQYSLGMLMSVVHLAAFPLVLRALEQQGEAQAREQLRKNVFILFLIAVPATAGMAMLASNIATVVLGLEFRESAAPIIAVVALSVLVAGIRSYYFDYSFQITRRIRGQLLTVLSAAVANVALNLWLIPAHGVLGAACATFGASVIGLLVSWHLSRRIFMLPALNADTYKVVLASAIMAAGLYLGLSWRGPLALLGQISMGCITYVVALLALNVDRSRPILRALLGIARPSRRAGEAR